MDRPEKLRLRGAPDNVEVVHEGETIIMRRIVSPDNVRAACREIRRYAPKAEKGESIVRELNQSRLRGER